MARKVVTFTVDAEGRDSGKVFLITEMSAMKAEKWASRALFSLASAGVDVPQDVVGSGMAGIAAVGLRAITSMDFDDAEPLLDEMMNCVHIVPDPAKPAIHRDLIEDDIEEIATLLRLRSEVVDVHVGFSIADALAKLGSAARKDLNS